MDDASSREIPGLVSGPTIPPVPNCAKDCAKSRQKDDQAEDDDDDLVDQSLHAGSLCAYILGSVLSDLGVLSREDNKTVDERGVAQDGAT